MIRIGLFGAGGHMGLTLVRAIGSSTTCVGCRQDASEQDRRASERTSERWPAFGRSGFG